MKNNKFDREELEFYVDDHLMLGLSKEYILECIFDEEIQKKWYPRIGDLIVGHTGNIFAIGGSQRFHADIGGEVFFFGGTMAAKSGSCRMTEPMSYSMNRNGDHFDSPYHSSWKNKRYIPRPSCK